MLGVEHLQLLLAAAGKPVPVDDLAATGLWRPSTLLAAIEDGRRTELLSLDSSRELVSWRGEGDARVARASASELAGLLASPPCLELLLSGARRAARERRFSTAEVLYRGVATVEPDTRRTFPGGEAAWVSAVVEATRLFRSAWTIEPVALEAAIASAEGRGDLKSQAVLLAARGVRALTGDLEKARHLFDRATEAAEAIEEPAIRTEVRTYIAVSLVLSGRPGEGVAAFEALLGDVQADLLDPALEPLLDLDGAVPASALSMLAHAYALMGDHPRAVDLMQRVLDRGVELRNQALAAQGHVMLAVTFMMAGELEEARAHAEAAALWFSTIASPYAWACAQALAWTRARDRPLEARALLAGALPAWRRTGRYWVGGSKALELLETLERAQVPPLEGLSVEEEVLRHLDAPHPLLAGIAHRWAAKRASSVAEARQHLEDAVRLLREAGAGPELELAVEDAEALERRMGHAASVECRGCEEGDGASREAEVRRLTNAVLDLGRLGLLSPRHEGLWGEVAARLCRELKAERCAILFLDDAQAPSVLAARGAATWRDAVAERVTQRVPTETRFEPALERGATGRKGQLVLVPFGDAGQYRGVVALENRDLPPRVGPQDVALLGTLGRQVGILLANVGLWRELLEMRQRLEQENRHYREVAPRAVGEGGTIVGSSAAMREVLNLVHRVARDLDAGAGDGRNGCRQGAGVAGGAPRLRAASGGSVHRGARGLAVTRARRERAVWARARRIHRSDGAGSGPLRAGARRDALPRRGGRARAR